MADSIIQQLYQRKILRIAVGYLAVAWVLWQVVGTTCPAFECSMQFQQSIFWFLIAGLPVTLAIAWVNWKTAILVGLGLLAGATVMFFAMRGPATETETAAITPQTTSDLARVPDFGGRPAIAVLPFDNLSPDPDQAFFADGLAGDLITRLSSWRAFPVIARNSSFQYRGGNVDLKRVGAELGVRYVVEGSVRRAGDRIRVTAQLIDTPSGEHVWAETYNREVKDLFALQDEISETIAASLVDDLNRAEGERARQRGTENLEAWSLYQLGLQRADRFTRADYIEAARLFERVVALDPRFATAHAQLAIAALWVAPYSGEDQPANVLAALDMARHAVELDPRDPWGHAALGWAYVMNGDPQNALDASRRAVELNPSMPQGWLWLGYVQLMAGDPQACIASTRRASQLNPKAPAGIPPEDNLAGAYWELGRYEEGLDASRRLAAALPDYYWAYVYMAMNAVASGRIDAARAAIAEGRRVEPRLSLDLIQRVFGVSRPDIDSRRNTMLRQAGLE